MKTTVVTPPDGEPVSLSAAKDYLRIGHDSEDALVRDLIASARARLELELDMALVARTVRLEMIGWPSALKRRGLVVRPGPLQELRSVQTSVSGVQSDVTDRFILANGRLCLKPWTGLPALPAGARVSVEYVAGFGEPGQVPDDLQLAVKLLTAQIYRLRSGDGDEEVFPREVDELLAPYQGVRL